MKIIQLILFTILCVPFSNGQDTLMLINSRRTSSNKHSVGFTQLKYNDWGQQISSLESAAGGDTVSTLTYYNEAHQKIMEDQYHSSTPEKRNTSYYNYDNDTITVTYVSTISGLAIYKAELKKDLNWNVLSSTSTHFDDKQNIVAYNEMKSDYDSLMQKIHVYYTVFNAQSAKSKPAEYFYEYDEAGRIFKEIYIQGNPRVKLYSHFIYDEKGRQIQKIRSNSNNPDSLSIQYSTYEIKNDSIYLKQWYSYYPQYTLTVRPLKGKQFGPTYREYYAREGELKSRTKTLYNKKGYPIKDQNWYAMEYEYSTFSNDLVPVDNPFNTSTTTYEYRSFSKNKFIEKEPD